MRFGAGQVYRPVPVLVLSQEAVQHLSGSGVDLEGGIGYGVSLSVPVVSSAQSSSRAYRDAALILRLLYRSARTSNYGETLPVWRKSLSICISVDKILRTTFHPHHSADTTVRPCLPDEDTITGSEKSDYAYSREHQPDANQINLGVHVTSETRIPLGYRVLAGRTVDRTTPLGNL